MEKETLLANKRSEEFQLFEKSLDLIVQDNSIEYNREIRSETTTNSSVDSNSNSIQVNIKLNGAVAGLQLAKRLADECNVPFVLLNADSTNARTSAVASVTIPSKYLHSSKETLLNKLSDTLTKDDPTSDLEEQKKTLPKITDAIFVKDAINYVKVPFQEIDFVKSDGNYIEIHWNNKKSVLKRTLKSIEHKLPVQFFFQIHRSYIANINKIESIEPTHIMINQHRVPISKSKKENLLEILNTIY